MAYDFNTPTEDDILRALTDRGFQRVMQEQPPPDEVKPVATRQQPREQRGGTEQINGVMERSLPALQESPREAPSPYAMGMRRGVLQNKLAYDTAKTDAERQTASDNADLLRRTAQAAGIDMGDVGADVALADATQNLASREAQDIMEAMQGRYAKTAEQYYQDTYLEGIMRGYSPRQSRRLASTRAQEYQANRVAYLDGLYNSYGRDGRVTSETGNQILAALAMENPTLAGFYAQIYPNQKDAYNRDNQLQDIALAQTNTFGRMGEQYRLNQLAADADQRRRQQDYAYRKGLDNTYQIGNEDRAVSRAREEEERAYQVKIARAEALADRWGFTGDGKKLFVTAAVGIKLPTGQGGKMSDDSLKNLKTLHDMLGSREKTLSDELNALQENMSADPQTISALQAQIADIQEKRESLERTYGSLIGATDDKPTKFTGDFEKDKTLIADMREEGKRRGLSAQQIKDAIFKYMVEQGADERYAKGAVGLD